MNAPKKPRPALLELSVPMPEHGDYDGLLKVFERIVEAFVSATDPGARYALITAIRTDREIGGSLRANPYAFQPMAGTAGIVLAGELVEDLLRHQAVREYFARKRIKRKLRRIRVRP